MTQHVYAQLEPEYARLVATARIRPEVEAVLEKACRRLLRDKDVYDEAFEKTGVPTAALMALAEREMTGNLHRYLGNGQVLTRRTTIVPIGRGPFPDTHEGFVAGCLDALRLDGLDKVAHTPEGWTLPRFGYESEDWNGWGYRSRGIPTPYFVGGTTAQRSGKFIADHVFDPNHMDEQLGTLAIVEKLFELDPSLVFGDEIQKIDASSIVPAPHPVVGPTNVMWVQTMLNRMRVAGTPLLVDDNLGRATRAAVAAFQRRHPPLVVDGLPGPRTVAAITQVAAFAGL